VVICGGKTVFLVALLAIATEHTELVLGLLIGMLTAFFMVFMIVKKIVRGVFALPSRFFGKKRA